MDTISTDATVAFAIECFENGIITKEDTDGLDLRWGATDAIVALVDKIGRRDGFGDILADGVARAAERIGPTSAEYAMAVAGEELPMHDPKLNPEYLTTFKLDPTPARHTQYDGSARARWGQPRRVRDRDQAEGRGAHRKAASEYVHVVNATGMCQFITEAAPNDRLPDWINIATGWDLTHAELLHAGFKLDVETLEREYLAAADIDAATGKPRRRKLEFLGLADVADTIGAE